MTEDRKPPKKVDWDVRPEWRSWVETRTVQDAGRIGTQFNIIIYPALDKKKDFALISKVCDGMAEGMGKVLADAGLIDPKNIITQTT